MAELVLVDDTEIEVAVFIDTDTYLALPIVAMGPNRVALLRAFAEQLPPYDWFTVDGLQQAWVTFLGTQGVGAEQVGEVTPDTREVEPQARNGTDDEAELAEAEARDHAITPAEQPADTDAPESAPSATVTVVCWNCNGTRYVSMGDGEPNIACAVCHGTGKVEQLVAR